MTIGKAAFISFLAMFFCFIAIGYGVTQADEIKVKKITIFCDLPVKLEPSYPTGLNMKLYKRCKYTYYQKGCVCRSRKTDK